MALVYNDHFASQAQMTQHQMLLAQRCHKELVNGGDHKIRQKALFIALKPLMDQNAAFRVSILLGVSASREHRPVFIIQFSRAVCQTQGVRCFFALRLCPGLQSPKDTVCRSLCGQAEVNASKSKTACQLLRSRQCRLCFPHAHLGFQHDDPGRCHGRGHTRHGLLHSIWRKAKTGKKIVLIHVRALALPGSGEPQFCQRLFHPGRIKLPAIYLIGIDQREVLCIARDPVGHREQPGEKQFFGDRQYRKLLHGGQTASSQRPLQ